MKKIIVTAWLMFLTGAIGALFWYNELIYQLPTPVPSHYKEVKPGAPIKIESLVKYQGDKPLFLHFYNPGCPCSRFNTPHFKSLVKQYGNRVRFAVVVMNDKAYTAKAIQNKLDLQIPVLFDASLASACGVYSTPQAVLIDQHHRLYYRGNYNQSRYCTNEKTSYAKQAIISLLCHSTATAYVPGQLALRAYGCKLPNCTN